ncbi:MAG: hypothetical protein ACTMUB_02720 [cyanobacterium endosymbiont of Rhopalodia musculus]|uniref:hypothetical protein n=1 Tax=cyanobacterium endosymbiont of Epithemia clementina EcSB TaxID=3034674 RepID=UPI002480BFFD|nr:hypothetical protein [cyanobacterium endosymbiont of Epithemia clementina EcSB]WGT67140.1 hypothetical protein P3F56_07890 [cyanobacterium endosymbiont of Epithemia clementina EcSB]
MIKRRFSVSVQELGTLLYTHGANFGATQLTLVQPQEPTKIDLSNDYSCLCRRRGPLFPIILTKFFGRDRCHPIFVFEENGQIIEQLPSSSPCERSWRWTDYFCWLGVLPSFGDDYLRITSGMIVVLNWMELVSTTIARQSQYGNLNCSYGTISNVIGNNFFVSLSALMQTLWQ